jgi:hypothetical protein
MKTAAIGIRMHSGWGALVAVSNEGGTLEIIDRQRVSLTASGARGGNQPYHFAKTLVAKNLDVTEAEKFLVYRLAESKRLAVAAAGNLVDKLSAQYRAVGVGLLLASGRVLPPLANILASHALIHAAEGEFFRNAFSKACESLDLPVTGFRERDLDESVRKIFGRAATRICQEVASVGRDLGPPWTKDYKVSTFAALMVLANRQS